MKKKKIIRRTQIGWAIAGTYGLYEGWCCLRKDAIEAYCFDMGLNNEQFKQSGGHAVKVTITWEFDR